MASPSVVSLWEDKFRQVEEAQEVAEGGGSIQDAEKAVENLYQEMVNSTPIMQKLRDRHLNREATGVTDGKLAPGSKDVRANLGDSRYVLSRLCITRAVLASLEERASECQAALREAIMWFPRSAHAWTLLGEIQRRVATTAAGVDESESSLRRAVSVSSELPTLTGNSPSELKLQNTFSERAGFAVTLILLQSGRSAEADNLLCLLGYRWRISEALTAYHKTVEGPRRSDANARINDAVVCAYDDPLLPGQLAHLRSVFRPQSRFWREHAYDTYGSFSRRAGYFSYLYEFRQRTAQRSVEQIIDRVRQLVEPHCPQLSEATVAEWWVHSRPHACGHQLHFDSDETRIEKGGSPAHPIVSCVLYLGESDVGGPTFVSDYTLGGSAATCGWFVKPRKNRLLVFNANYLHGVFPGSGPAPCGEERRLTFMVGFWRKLEARDLGVKQFGAAQPFPRDGTTFTWPEEVPLQSEWNSQQNTPTPVPEKEIHFVEPVWHPLKPDSVEHTNYKTYFQGF